MENLNKLYKQLDQYKDFNKNDNDQKFLEIVDKIVDFHDPKSFKILIKYFDDSDRGWVLPCLVSAVIDYLDEEKYTICFLKDFNTMFPHAKEFCSELFYPIILEKECLKTFKQNIYLADKISLKQLFDLIYEESEEHRPIIDELKEVLNKS